MPHFTIPRSGSAPLAFEGHEIASVSGKKPGPGDKRITRWHDLSLYRAASGRYVVAIHFRCETRHDDPYDEAEVFEKPEDVIKYLEDFDPVEGVRGWTQQTHAEQDRRLREALTNNYERLVSELLADQPEFVEKV